MTINLNIHYWKEKRTNIQSTPMGQALNILYSQEYTYIFKAYYRLSVLEDYSFWQKNGNIPFIVVIIKNKNKLSGRYSKQLSKILKSKTLSKPQYYFFIVHYCTIWERLQDVKLSKRVQTTHLLCEFACKLFVPIFIFFQFGIITAVFRLVIVKLDGFYKAMSRLSEIFMVSPLLFNIV